AATAQVWLRVDAAHFQPHDIRHRKEWSEGNVESTVGIEQGWVLAVELEAFFVGQKHGHAGAVFAVVEDLFGFVAAGIEVDFGMAVDRALSSLRIVMIDRGW